MSGGGLGPRGGPETVLRRLRRRLGRETWLRSKALAQRAGLAGSGPQQVVFVAGVQRSGTNMLIEILERSWYTDVYREADRRAFFNYEHKPLPELARVLRRSPARFVIVKALSELQDLTTLLHALAPARALWMLRHYDDVVNSATELWRKMPHFLGEILHQPDGGEAGWRGRGVSADTRAELARHWRADIDNPTACALFWWLRNVLFFEQGLDRDPRVRWVSYEALVADPRRQVPALFAFAQVPFQPHVMRRVSARSVRKHPPAAIDLTVRRLCDGLLERYDAIPVSVADRTHVLYG